MRESLENSYNPPVEELILHERTEDWARSLIKRHNEGGHLSLLEYDPQKYHFQRIDQALIEPYSPNPVEMIQAGIDYVNDNLDSFRAAPPTNELMALGRKALQKEALFKIGLSGRYAIGEEAYENLVVNLQHLGGSEKFPENGLRTIWARMHTAHNNSAILTRHSNLMDTPLVQKSLIDAFSRSDFLKEERYIRNFGEFDVFDFAEQNFQTIGFALTRISYDGVPVVELLGETNNTLIVMPIKGSRAAGIDRKTIVAYNRLAKEKRQAKIDSLYSKGLSVLDHIAPAGTTAKRIEDSEGNVVALRSDPMDIMMAEALAQENPYMVPVTVYLNGDPNAPKFHVGEPKAVYRGDQVIALNSEMARQTERMSGKRFYECTEEALGSLVLEDSLLNAKSR